MILPIYVYGAQVLREKAKEVDVKAPGIEQEIKSFVSDMWETMDKADGVGLAAPQVGKSIRVLIVDGTPLSDDMPELNNFKRAMINPSLLEESDQLVDLNEGCLSIPDINAFIKRPHKIKVSYLDIDFNEVTEELEGFACRMVQHEMDHLEGILFTDRAAPIRRKMLNSKLKNIEAGKVHPSYKIAK
ncbi:MAG: peptide deformylase [Bacteroidales bacterium]